MLGRTLLGIVVGLAAVACGDARQPVEVPRDAVAVDPAATVVLHGSVGAGPWETQATYALVSARNRSDQDLLVTVGGVLVGGTGRHDLRSEALRVPAGGERLFALVDASGATRSDAVAEAWVLAAKPLTYPPPVAVTGGKVHPDQGRAVVAAFLENRGRTEARVPVIAAFYDDAGRPVARPFTVVTVAGGGKRGVQLVGPPGSVSAQLYTGEVQF